MVRMRSRRGAAIVFGCLALATISAGTMAVGVSSAPKSSVTTVSKASTNVVTVVSGGAQSVLVRTQFSKRLVARVLKAGKTPVPGVQVKFTTPKIGVTSYFTRSGCQAGTVKTVCIVKTNKLGVATATMLTANEIPGPYIAQAATPGTAKTAVWHLWNGLGYRVTFGTVTPALLPGAPPAAIPVTIQNPNPFAISVAALTIAAHNATCDPAQNIRIVQLNPSAHTRSHLLTVPAHGSVALPAQGVAAPAIQLIDTGVNQTAACANQAFDLTYTGWAIP